MYEMEVRLSPSWMTLVDCNGNTTSTLVAFCTYLCSLATKAREIPMEYILHIVLLLTVATAVMQYGPATCQSAKALVCAS
jgi:hypothetical protein